MKKILFLLIFSGALFGQGQYIPARTVLGTVNGITRPISGATITVCAANTGGIPCSPALANTVFQDQALQVPLSNPFQTDSNGNYPQAAVASGTYTVTESAAGFVGFSYQLTVTCSPGVGCTFGPIVATSGTINGPLTVSGISTLNAVSAGPVTATSVTVSGATIDSSGNIATTTGTIGVNSSSGFYIGSISNKPRITFNSSNAGFEYQFLNSGNGIAGVQIGGADLFESANLSTSATGHARWGASSASHCFWGNNNAGSNYCFAGANFSADNVIYVSPQGNDSNNGFSWGQAKATLQAAFDTSTATGTKAGTVIAAPGSYACPTTVYSNQTLLGEGHQSPSNFANGFSLQNTALNGTTINCTSGTNFTVSTVSNIHWENLAISFNNSGGGLVLNAVIASRFKHVSVQLAGNGTTPAVLITPGAVGPTNNAAWNTFDDLDISTTTTNAVAATCVEFLGTGTVNAGQAPTNNILNNTICTGNIKNGLQFEKNTDSNQVRGFLVNNQGPAAGDALVFNSTTPASDQDADNEIVKGFCATGSFNHQLSMGESFGNNIEICGSAGEITPNVLGGSPQLHNTIFTTGLFGIPSVIATPKLRLANNLLTGVTGSGANVVTDTSPAITTPTIARETINTGISQGSGFKHQRFGATTATAASAGSAQSTAYTWTAGFADASYTVSCVGVSPTNAPILTISGSGKTGAGFSVTVIAATAAAASFGEVDCIAAHD